MITDEEGKVIVNEEESVEETGVDEEIVEETSDNSETGAEGSEEGEEEIVITFGDEETEEEEPVQDSSVIRGLRDNNRKLTKKLKEFENKQSTEIKPVELGARPTIEDCGWDEDKLISETDKWYEKKREFAQLEAEKATVQETQTKAWQGKVNSYVEAQAELKVNDFVDMEDVVKDSLNVAKQGLILQCSNNAAKLVYALGKNPKKRAELKAIKDDVDFIVAVVKMEASLKVSTRKPNTKPEKRISGSGGTAGAVDDTETRLREKAVESGDFTELHNYKRNKKK